MQGKVFERIASVGSGATKTEKILIKKITSVDPSELIYMSITELALKLNIAEATILRFCRKLGYKGFQDFKLNLSQDLGSTDNASLSNAGEVIKKKILEGLDFSCKNLDYAKVDSVSEAIWKSRKLCVFGLGNSYVATNFASARLIKAGIIVSNSPDPHVEAIEAGNLNKDDVVILCSVTGGTKDIIDVAKIAHDNKATVVVITNYVNSPLAKYGKYIFVSSGKEAPYEGGTVSSIVSQIFILDVICDGVFAAGGNAEAKKVMSAAKYVSGKAI
jgi:DNA-binding MurR/RpiR family transcriptional regulator